MSIRRYDMNSLMATMFFTVVIATGSSSFSDERDATDIREAQGRLVSIEAHGAGLGAVSLELSLRVNREVSIVIPAGLVFLASSDAVQNMVIVRREVVHLTPDRRTVTVSLSASCANMKRTTPGKKDTFRLGSYTTSADLSRLLASPHFEHLDFRERQFAIWTVTDNPAPSEYVGIGSFGFGSGPSGVELYIIRLIFLEAGIDQTRYQALKQIDEKDAFLRLADAKRLGFVETTADVVDGGIANITVQSLIKQDIDIKLFPGTKLLNANKELPLIITKESWVVATRNGGKVSVSIVSEKAWDQDKLRVAMREGLGTNFDGRALGVAQRIVSGKDTNATEEMCEEAKRIVTAESNISELFVELAHACRKRNLTAEALEAAETAERLGCGPTAESAKRLLSDLKANDSKRKATDSDRRWLTSQQTDLAIKAAQIYHYNQLDFAAELHLKQILKDNPGSGYVARARALLKQLPQ